MAKSTEKMEKIVALCKRRGFIFQSSEIYGGINGFWDYGPLGVELKRNIKDAWWLDMVRNPPPGPDGKEFQMVGLDAALIMNPKVWEASGHVGGFSDPMVDCTACKKRFRADKVWFVNVYPRGSIRNESDVLDQNSEPVFDTAAKTTRVAAEIESGVANDAAEAVVQFARKNNVGFLKSFMAHGTERRVGPSRVYFQGRKSDKREPECEEHDFECLIEQVLSSKLDGKPRPCPSCYSENSLTEPRSFNLMFQTFVGASQDSSSVAYLRPETAQGIFANFKNVVDTSRVKLPFGIGQIGKAFRNEINPRNYIFRSREFEQMEIEFFCHDDDAMKWWEWWRDVRIKWYVDLGLSGDNLRPRNQEGDELAHYSKACTDIEYCFPFADEPQELEGVAHRGCYDLTQHQKHSGKDLTYFDDERKERYLPTVIEPSAGADRSALAFLCEAYTVDDSRPSPEFMKFHPRLAPTKAAVFP
ncbi:MAG: glycine--tRNA ligase, partial [Planctomycetota bacterium]|nr:glycine--tRNA ligase [Planctomycetota bacterium]